MSLKSVTVVRSSTSLLQARALHSGLPLNGVIRDALRKARELANATKEKTEDVDKIMRNKVIQY
ncbi:unnamed protein product [Strongylus vulgaris]|uniref:Uncharacterized protein n=1 Tax=Strongylus vulgaris TaxID=40348 RepID=A0A3P7K9Y5_STRVU|nr:unnamed protein product [Strongylus vulgaris]